MGGWGAFLGTSRIATNNRKNSYVSYEEAKQWAADNQILTRNDWLKAKLPLNIPRTLNLYPEYNKNGGFEGFTSVPRFNNTSIIERVIRIALDSVFANEESPHRRQKIVCKTKTYQVDMLYEHLNSDVYLNYCEKTNTLGFGSCFNLFDQEFHKYIEITKEKFEHHPKYNETEWLFKIFEDSAFQSNLDKFNVIPENVKSFVIETLIKNPQFLERQLIWNNNENNIEKLSEHLKKTKVKALIDVAEQIKNEKTIKNEVNPNLPKKTFKPSRF